MSNATNGSKLSRADRTLIFSVCKRLASMVERAADARMGTSRLYDDLRKTIADQEKGHRRFAPSGWRHLFSVEQAVDYFVVRTVANANPDATARDLAMLRDDYVKATFLMCDEEVRQRLAENLARVWPGKPAADVFRALAEVDYCALSGTANGLDPETLAGLACAYQLSQKAVV